MTPEAIQETIKAIRDKAKRTGGWEAPKSRWAARIGLKRNQVDQWASRGEIPHPWRLILKASLKTVKGST
jgi:hypothetical protein